MLSWTTDFTMQMQMRTKMTSRWLSLSLPSRVSVHLRFHQLCTRLQVHLAHLQPCHRRPPPLGLLNLRDLLSTLVLCRLRHQFTASRRWSRLHCRQPHHCIRSLHSTYFSLLHLLHLPRWDLHAATTPRILRPKATQHHLPTASICRVGATRTNASTLCDLIPSSARSNLVREVVLDILMGPADLVCNVQAASSAKCAKNGSSFGKIARTARTRGSSTERNV